MVLSGDQAGEDYVTVTDTEISPFLNITGSEAVAKNWLLEKKAPPEHMFGADVTAALQHLDAAAGLLKASKLNPLEAAFLAVYKRQIKENPYK